MVAVGRADLPAGLRVAQMCHALRAYAALFPFIESRWFVESNTLVLLEATDGAALHALAQRIRAAGSTVVEFVDEDLPELGTTALAVGPDGARFTSSLPLALR